MRRAPNIQTNPADPGAFCEYCESDEHEDGVPASFTLTLWGQAGQRFYHTCCDACGYELFGALKLGLFKFAKEPLDDVPCERPRGGR